MAYPGSQLYTMALQEKWELPKEWHGYSQHAYTIQPLPSKYLSAKEILAFRDQAFDEYFQGETYLTMIEHTFGKSVRTHMESITQIKLKRRLLEE